MRIRRGAQLSSRWSCEKPGELADFVTRELLELLEHGEHARNARVVETHVKAVRDFRAMKSRIHGNTPRSRRRRADAANRCTVRRLDFDLDTHAPRVARDVR